MKILDVIELNKVVKCDENKKNQILFPSLYSNAIQLVMYTDASFNTLDGISQGVYIIFLRAIHNKYFLLTWNSSRPKF